MRRFWSQVGVLAILALVSALAVPTMAGERPAKLAIGTKVPDFSLKNVLDGKTLSLTELAKGKKAVVIMFIATRCPISRACDKRMRQLAEDYIPRGVQFIGINSNHIEPEEEVTQHARQQKFPFPVLKDFGNVVADKYQARVTPELFILDANLVLRYHGAIDNNHRDPSKVDPAKRYARMALDAILAGKEVNPTEVPATGCTIKRVPKKAPGSDGGCGELSDEG